LPHTADVIVAAWGLTLVSCFAEAVAGLVECFADVGGAADGVSVDFQLEPAEPVEQLLRLLDEVIYTVEVHDVVPVRVELAATAGGGLTGRFTAVPVASLRPVGPVPKAATRHELELAATKSGWRCQVTIDV
jgi:SHS2 domain-containing protein